MSLKSHFFGYGLFAFLILLFIVIGYSSEFNWASTGVDASVVSNGSGASCSASLDIYTGLFKKKSEAWIESCGANPESSYSDTTDLGCFIYGEIL
jgi:hypothetical protein